MDDIVHVQMIKKNLKSPSVQNPFSIILYQQKCCICVIKFQEYTAFFATSFSH